MMKFTFRAKIICMLLSVTFFITSATAQEYIIKGTVKDTFGEPMIGVTIQIEGTSIGTITDFDGGYAIQVPNPQIELTFSFVGYDTQVIAIEGRDRIDVTMHENTTIMEDLIVIGYGTVTKRSLSTAVSTVYGSKVADMPTGNLAQSLVGLSSGVTFQQISGQPGESPAIRIRGNGSINSGNDPLFVIDGYPTSSSSDFANINPQDVESIQILKDAASSAIYGSRAGNGVIIVTTKRGKDGKPDIRFSSQVGISQPSTYVDVLGRDDYLEMVIEARVNNGSIDNFPALQDLWNRRSSLPDNNWQKDIFRNALNHRTNISVTGGTEKIKYNFSASYLNEDGILLNSFNKRINIKGGFEALLTDKIKLGVNFSPTYNYTRAQNPSGGNTEDVTGIIAEALTFPPIFIPYTENGDYFQVAQHAGGQNGYPNYGFNTQIRNPVANLMENFDNRWSFRSLNNAFLEFRPIEKLVIRSSVDLMLNSYKRDFYQTAYLLGNNYMGNKSTPNFNTINGYRSSLLAYDIYSSTTATYNWSINEYHNFTTLLGYDVEYFNTFNVRQDDRTDSDYPIAYTQTNITNVNGANLWNGSSNVGEYAFDAIFGRLNYDYNHKYVVSASLRRDRSSKFGPSQRAGIFYSGSAAWNISEEEWGKSDWLTSSKIRLSYGLTGNDQIGNYYSWLAALENENQVVFGMGENMVTRTSYYPNGYSNLYLGWEKNSQWDLGVDLGFFHRFGLTVDLYRRVSEVVMTMSIPNFNGISSSIMANSGEIENKGFEAQLTIPILTNAFQWTATLNGSKNINKILTLANGQSQLSNQSAGTKWSNVIRNYVGRPMGDMYMLKVIGTFNNADDVKNHPNFGTQAIGDLMYEDYSKDGKIDNDDFQFVGNYQPDFTFGLTNSFEYKNFDLNFTIDGQVGGKIIFAAARAFTLNRYDDNVLTESGLGRWRSEDSPGNGTSHKAGSNNLGSNINASNRYLYSSDYLRLRNLGIGYLFPKNISRKFGFEMLRLSLNAQNLYTFDKYPGYSVESNYSGNSATNNGVDFGSYPLSRTITFGINIGF
ncbi:MAG: TonB-dependent receptor [Tannerellaceae bacterium]|jgi:TonB-linked SusC/RagA family outer membrane protein|nr:TonB-dependent receptor [Tannerellaceae bacterium]